MNTQETIIYDRTHNIPQRLLGIKTGDVVKIRNNQTMTNFARIYGRDVRCGWNSEMRGICGNTFEITREMLNNILTNDPAVTRKWGWTISLDMLEFYQKNKNKEQLVDKEILEKFSIKKNQKNADIINEMIAKVDKIRFKKLLAIGANSGKNICLRHISDTVVNSYLQKWAESKYEFYLLFDKNLFIQKDIETEITNPEMGMKITDLCYRFPKYAPILMQFNTGSYVNNSCGYNGLFDKFCKTYNPSEKLSSFLVNLLQDKEFSDSLAETLSNRMIKAKLAISIDPYDYLTMSLNGYDWESCQKIGKGSYASGTLSLMLDEYSLIAFKYNGAEQIYNINNYKFVGNSKSWRQCIYIDKQSLSAIFSRQYPSTINVVAKLTREYVEDIISQYKGIENRWKVSHDVKSGYVSSSSCLYHDVFGEHEMKKIFLSEKPISEKFLVGKNIHCVICGQEISNSSENFVCGDCYSSSQRLPKESFDLYVTKKSSEIIKNFKEQEETV